MPPIQDATKKTEKYVYRPFPAIRYRAVKPGEKDPNNDGFVGRKFESPDEILESEEKGEGPWFNTPLLTNVERVTVETLQDQAETITNLQSDLNNAKDVIAKLTEELAAKDAQIADMKKINDLLPPTTDAVPPPNPAPPVPASRRR